jgi:hypothetical protein
MRASAAQRWPALTPWKHVWLALTVAGQRVLCSDRCLSGRPIDGSLPLSPVRRGASRLPHHADRFACTLQRRFLRGNNGSNKPGRPAHCGEPLAQHLLVLAHPVLNRLRAMTHLSQVSALAGGGIGSDGWNRIRRCRTESGRVFWHNLYSSVRFRPAPLRLRPCRRRTLGSFVAGKLVSGGVGRLASGALVLWANAASWRRLCRASFSRMWRT